MAAEPQDFENPTLADIGKNVGKLLMATLYDQVTTLRTPWVITPQQQQAELLDRMRRGVEQAVAVAVASIAKQSFPNVSAQLDSLTIKDEAKVQLALPRGTQDIHRLADHVGSKVVIVFADPAAYADGLHEFESQADQKPLPLED